MLEVLVQKGSGILGQHTDPLLPQEINCCQKFMATANFPLQNEHARFAESGEIIVG